MYDARTIRFGDRLQDDSSHRPHPPIIAIFTD